MSTSTAPREPLLDGLTVAALAAIAISLTVGLHEGAHALACVVVGGRLQEYSALHAECDFQTLVQHKLVAGAAPLYNMLAGLLLWAAIRRARWLAPESWTFCWLLMSMNLFYSAGYFLLSGVAGIGDMAVVIEGWRPAWLWRVGLLVLGTPLLVGCIRLALQTFGRRIGGVEPERTRRANRLYVTSYVTSAGVVALAGLAHPDGPLGLPASAGLMGVLGALSPLLWMTRLFGSWWLVQDEAAPLEIHRRWSWVAAAAVVVAVYAAVLGRTLHF